MKTYATLVPAVENENHQPGPQEDSEQLVRSRSENYILLVEDNQDDIDLTLLVLKDFNLANDLVVLRDGAEALDFVFGRARYQGPQPWHLPQVILLDINLPKLSGLDVLKALREDERTHLVPIVMLTTSREERDIMESYASGANSYVQKPFEFNEFAQAISQLGLYWFVLNKAP